MRTTIAAVMLCLASLAYGNSDISKVNGSIHVTAGQTVGKVSSVNGAITIDQDVTARNVETVNGAIRVGARSRVETLEAVNGSITLAEGATAQSMQSVNGALRVGSGSEVAGNVASVNGAITAEAGARIQGNVENVNGKIMLEQAHVAGRLKSTNGGIEVGAQSYVGNGILVTKPRMSGFSINRSKPKIVIGPGAVVDGTLKFEREVELYVSESAKIGPVEGATPVKFSGTRP
jgi:DUF4097 and DUF4098 domain-containing protein YvlB